MDHESLIKTDFLNLFTNTTCNNTSAKRGEIEDF